MQETEAAPKALGLTVTSVAVRTPASFEAAFRTMSSDRAAALSVPTSALFSPHRRRLAELAIKHRLPTVSGGREWADAGFLVAYGPDYLDLAATVVDKILNGANPGDLPIEGLRQLGYVEGNTITITAVWPRTPSELPELAASLARQDVELIVAPSSPAVAALKRVTSGLPIVFATAADPVHVRGAQPWDRLASACSRT